MLPAREGDCLWITYGEPGDPRHVLVDGGRKATAKAVRAKLEALPRGSRRLELLVISHIDRDHIEGVLELLERGLKGVEIGDVWFNGYQHLLAGRLDPEGAAQAEALSAALLAGRRPWNKAFSEGAVCIEEGRPVTREIAGGMRLTVLSPTPEKLAALLPTWEKECAKAGLIPGGAAREDVPGLETFGLIDVEALAAARFVDDTAPANGASIVLLAEFGGRRVLLGADAHATVLETSLRALAGPGKVRLDAFKVPHHGSAHNLSKAVLDLIDCPRYLLSTNGDYFNHPDRGAIARLVRHGGKAPTLVFNYRSPQTEAWDDATLLQAYQYSVLYPNADANGNMVVEL
jgi:beta-lactamase superfamily II metal-dependent hydrolase